VISVFHQGVNEIVTLLWC